MKQPKIFLTILVLSLRALLPCSAEPTDIVIADFEGTNYGDWKVIGEAFGSGPAHGTLPKQHTVTGFRGHGLVNTFFDGDSTTGLLLSPRFKIERPYINFLIGGGNHSNATCINLIIDDRIVRSTTGRNDEKLDWSSWNVIELNGKFAQIQILDEASGSWGHINIDQIEQSLMQRSASVGAEKLYDETWRPQFHFTAQQNWLNDPNGLVFFEGEYHLFFQHIPVEGKGQWWGHAISTNLVHWTQLADAIAPDKLGPIWSGSAVIDWQNTAGFENGTNKTLVAIYTCAGGQTAESKDQPFTQNLAYSTDRGRTLTKYERNPVLPQIAPENRDPKVIWHEPTRQWIMIFFKTGNLFALYSSPDLKTWTHLQDLTLPGGAECPDIFEIPVEDKSDQKKWIITSASGNYTIGNFDGKTFSKESGPHRGDWGKNFYAVQTWSDIPKSDGRRIQISWMAWASYPGMPFNQQMSFPCELKLRDLPEGLRLCRLPVKEIDALHAKEHSWQNKILNPDENPLADLSGELFDIRAEIDLGEATEIGFKLRGEPIHYSLVDRKLSCLGQSAPLDPIAHRLKFQILLDRTSIEVFANDGRLSMATCFLPDRKNRSLQIYANNGAAKIIKLDVDELRSIWPHPQ